MGVSVEDNGTDNRVEARGDATPCNVRIGLWGRRNRVDIGEDLRTDYLCQIVIHGDDNVVTLGEAVRMGGPGPVKNPMGRTQISVVGDRNHIAIGRACSGPFNVEIEADEAEVVLGEHCTAVMARLQLLERARITLGNDCMLSGNVVFQVSDGHPIYDRDSGARINPPADIHIGDHVWLAAGVRILKGAEIGAGSVVGADSVVTGSIPPNCVAVGVPARVVRENVEWRRDERRLSARATRTIDV